MLNGLRDIDWNQFGHPSLPDWIEALASSDEKIRSSGYDAIYEANLDDLHWVSPSIVPFLIELLRNDVQEKDSILLLLMQIAYSARSVIESHYKTYDLADKTLKALGEGVDLFLSVLTLEEYHLYHNLELLSRLNEQSSKIISSLSSMLENPKTIDAIKPMLKRVISDLSKKNH
jgi:hypothetical protein